MKRRALLGLSAVLLAIGPNARAERIERMLHRTTVQRPFADVLLDLEFAITDHNFRITGANHIGAAIGERIGQPFPEAEVIHFCNLEYARRLLEIDPDFLSYMPCQITVIQGQNGVIVSTWLLPDRPGPPAAASAAALIDEINAIMRAIVDYATVDFTNE
jgi:uncharacterized protein (DUF302 family)